MSSTGPDGRPNRLARLGLTTSLVVARLLFWLYPPSFRRIGGRQFGAVAAHTYWREWDRCGNAFTSLGLTLWILLMDTVRAAPPLWRSAAVRRNEMLWLRHWSDDVGLALRTVRRQRVFAVLVVGTLGLGIGASAAAYSALNRVVIHPLAFPDGDRLAFVSMLDIDRGSRTLPPLSVVERWRATSHTVERFEVYQPASVTDVSGGLPEVVPAARITSGLPALLQVTPVAGRIIGATDGAADAPPVIMISESFWRRRFGAAPSVIGRTLQFGPTIYTIVGVWPQRGRVDPTEQPGVFIVGPREDLLRPSSWAYLIAKLRPGFAMSEAEADLASQLGGLTEVREGTTASVTAPTEFLGPAYVRGLWLVFGASVLLMLVAVANAASLLLARAAARTGELGVRLALGGSTWRLVRMFLAEGAVLSIAGAALALGVAAATSQGLGHLAGAGIPPEHFDGIDSAVYGWAALGALCSMVVCGLVPAFQSRAVDIRRVAGFGVGRVMTHTSRVRQTLIGVQAAVGVVLLAAALLMSRSVWNLASFDVGFAVDELVTLTIVPPSTRYDSPAARAAFTTQVRDTVAAIPGVTGIVTSGMPLFRLSTQEGVPYLDGEPPPGNLSGQSSNIGASPEYFDVMGIPVRQGRAFLPSDQRGVVIVNESFARAKGGNVVGRLLYQPRRGFSHDQLTPMEIIGVVGDVRRPRMDADESTLAEIYLPMSGAIGEWARFMIRTDGDAGAVLAEARRRIAVLDPALAVRGADTGSDLFRAEAAKHRFVAVLLACLAALGVGLAVAGVYGAVALDVRRRVREVGLRVALGSTGAQVVALFVRRGMRPVLAGAVVGAVIWWWTSALLDALLFEIEARDPSSLVLGVAVLAAIAAAACAVPARQASRVDASATLRVD